MKRREFLKVAAGSAAGVLFNGCSEPLVSPSRSKRKPNIIFIMADDLGFGNLGCYGGDKILTPSIDRMAREGMRFTEVYAGHCVCDQEQC